MRQWADKAKRGYKQVIRATIIDVSTNIAKRTPVDTGRARGNWFPSLDTPITTSDLRFKYGKGGAGVFNSSLYPAAANAAGHKYYLTNNLPYIFRLEYQGWSKQAPNGMVRVSVIEFQQALTKAISEL